MRRSLLLGVLLAAGVGCAPPPSPRSIADSTSASDDGGEIQSADAWKAEDYMWKRCPRGFTVVKSEEIAVGAVTSNDSSFDRLATPEDLVERSGAKEFRKQFKCARPVEATAAIAPAE